MFPCTVSIIVPFYNSERVLKYCLDSIIKQSYNSWEAILVNDGSIDGSRTIVQEYSNMDSRVRIIDKPNGGVSDARNVGLKSANGKNIAFLDADDYISTNYLDVLIRVAEKNNASIVQSSVTRVKGYDEECIKTPSEIREYSVAEFISNNSQGKSAVWGKLILRSIASKYRFPYVSNAEDIFFNGLIFSDSEVKSVFYTQETVYYYVDNANSIMHSLDVQDHLDSVMIIYKLYDILKKNSSKRDITDLYLLTFFSRMFYVRYILIGSGLYRGRIKKEILHNRVNHIISLFKTNVSFWKKLGYFVFSFSNSVYKIYLFKVDPTMKMVDKKFRMDRKVRKKTPHV